MTKTTTAGPAFSLDVAGLLGRTRAEARPYQQRIVHRSMQSFAPKDEGGKDLRSVMIESPTGSGKTIMGLLTAKAMQERFADVGEDLEIGWISMRRNLLSQAERENAAKGINAKIRFISMFEKNLPPELVFGEDNPLMGKRRMLIVDEAQHDAANSMAGIHAKVQPHYILGMTATPFRTDHVKLCFDTVLKDAGLATLIQDGYLSKYNHFTIPDWKVDKVCDFYLREPERWGKSIFYFHTLEQCAQATNILQDAGVTVEMVTGSSDREEQIGKFLSGEVRALVNCMVLTEGFDCPDLQSVFCRPSCKGATIQMCGRAFRKHPSAPFKQIVQCSKGWPFIKLALPELQFKWDTDRNDWVCLTPNRHINEMNCRMLGALATINTQLPEFMVKQAMSAPGRRRRRTPWDRQ